MVLIVSHGGVISVLRQYLLGNGYRLHDSLAREAPDFWELRNCSITEVNVGEQEPGEFIRLGDWDHIASAFNCHERLENSTG